MELFFPSIHFIGLNGFWLSLLSISNPLLFCSIAVAKEILTESEPFHTASKNNNLIGNKDDTDGVTVGVTLGVTVADKELEGEAEIEEVTDIEGVEEKLVEGVFVGVPDGVLVGVPDGVLVGVLVVLGVTEEVVDIDGVFDKELEGDVVGVLELEGEAVEVVEGVGVTVAWGAISSFISCLISNSSDLELVTLEKPMLIKNAFINFLLSIV